MGLDIFGQMAVTGNNISPVGMTIVISALAAQLLKEVGIPSPGVTQGALIYAGYLGTTGNYLLSAAIILGILAGSLCGALISYCLGRFMGTGFIKRYGKYLHITQERLELINDKISTKAWQSILIGRFVPGAMAPLSIIAGIISLPVVRFLAGVAVAVLLWECLFLGIGALGRQFVENIRFPGISNLIPVLLGVAAVVVLIRILVIPYWFRRRKLFLIKQEVLE
jgi:membrane protein DedA with SNARE-associated domain